MLPSWPGVPARPLEFQARSTKLSLPLKKGKTKNKKKIESSSFLPRPQHVEVPGPGIELAPPSNNAGILNWLNHCCVSHKESVCGCGVSRFCLLLLLSAALTLTSAITHVSPGSLELKPSGQRKSCADPEPGHLSVPSGEAPP